MKKTLAPAVLSILVGASASSARAQVRAMDLLKSKDAAAVAPVAGAAPVPSTRDLRDNWEIAVDNARTHLSGGKPEGAPGVEFIHRSMLPMEGGKPDAEAFYISFKYQTYEGLPIYGTDATVRVIGSEVEVFRNSWRPLGDIKISAAPKLTDEQARRALIGLKLEPGDGLSGYDLRRPGTLAVYPVDKPGAKTEYKLIWSIRAGEDAWPPGRQWTIFVDANTGEVLKSSEITGLWR